MKHYYLQFSEEKRRFGMFADIRNDWYLVNDQPMDDSKAHNFIYKMIEKYGPRLDGVTADVIRGEYDLVS